MRIQDSGIGKFDPIRDHEMYTGTTSNCELHEFRGELLVENAARQFKKTVSGCTSATQRERLPCAFVSLDSALLASCEQQAHPSSHKA